MKLSQDTVSDLRSAFIAESMTAQRYAYFAQTAGIEGLVEISNLFTELAESAACAAHGHLDLLQTIDPGTGRPIGETHLNVAAAVSGELKDATDFYPRLAAAAHEHGLADVASWLETMCALKKAHVGRLEQALDALTGGSGVPGAPSPEPARSE